MINIKKLSKYALVGAILAFSNSACTDLTETLYDTIPEFEKGGVAPTEAQVNSILLSIYTNMGPIADHNNLFSIQEVSTDEMIIPQRGGDWYDGGQWIRMHRHQYTPSEESLNNVWRLLYTGVSRCNTLLDQIKGDAALAGRLNPEIRGMRALYYFWLCDVFGNVPIVTIKPGPEAIPQGGTKTRAEVYAFVESELNAVVGSLSKDKAASYGKMNYYSAKAILAKLYLNANVYKGAPEWAKCVAACNDIITDAKYSLETDYYNNFDASNEDSKENIFVIPYDAAKLEGFHIGQMSLHYASKATFELTEQPWNGYCSVAEFYNSYSATDKRRANFLAGQQYAADGVTKIEDSAAEGTDPDGKLLNFTPELNQLYPRCLRQAGVRVAKYKIEKGAKPNLNNDFPLFRFADVWLMKAEALWRQNAADPMALTMVNDIRTRAGVPVFTALTSDDLLAELGREKFAEAWRRNDLIRFGKYFKPYNKFKTTEDKPCVGIFPIPELQLRSSKSLIQNECYK
jgi:starch-binding outer membrane protein, SusD/RagB family